MLELEAALERILAVLPPPVPERVPLAAAVGRILAEDMVARVALPPFDNSSMDGFAVRAADVATAGTSTPVTLQVIGRIAAGETVADELKAGQCFRIFTGSPVPRGADAVVMQEDTRREPDHPDRVLVCDRVQAGENIRRRGEDVAAGERLLAAGEELNAPRLGLLAAMGLREVKVNRQPTVGLLATGSELRSAGEPLPAGQIYESNRAALAPLVARAGGRANVFPLVPDDLAGTETALRTALAECDLVVTSGGISVGETDFVKPAFANLGGKLEFWKVAIRPGKPFAFGRCAEKFLFGLPGNPVSALVTFLLLVRPALLRWQGATRLALRAQAGIAGEAFANTGDRRHFLRVQMDEAGKVFSAGRQASHVLSSLAKADAFLDLAAGETIKPGDLVRLRRWD